MPPDLLAVYVPQIVQQGIADRALAYEAARLGLQVTPDEADNAIMDTLPPQLRERRQSRCRRHPLRPYSSSRALRFNDLKQDTARELLVSRLKQIVGQSVVVFQTEIENESAAKNE